MTRMGLLLTLVSLAGAAPAMAQTACAPKVAPPVVIEAGKLVMSINPTLPPMQFVDASGELKGLNVDLGNEVAKRLCLKPEYIRIDFNAMVPGLQAKRWDLINTGIFWTEERSKIMYLINYGSQAVSVLTAAGNPLGVKVPEDLAGRSVAVEAGTYAERRLRQYSTDFTAKGAKAIDIRVFNTGAEGYQALQAGQVETSMTIDTTAADLVKRTNFHWAMKGIGGAPIAFAAAQKPMAQAVADALNEIRKDGTYAKIFAAYGFAELPEASFVINGPGPQ
jgi:polar amino acid transport system substrate-binding protein